MSEIKLSVRKPDIIKKFISSPQRLDLWQESYERNLEIRENELKIAALVNCKAFEETVAIASQDGKPIWKSLKNEKKGSPKEDYIMKDDGTLFPIKAACVVEPETIGKYGYYLPYKFEGRDAAWKNGKVLFEKRRCLVIYYYFRAKEDEVKDFDQFYIPYSNYSEEKTEEYRLVMGSIFCCRKIIGVYNSFGYPFYEIDAKGKEIYNPESINSDCLQDVPTYLDVKYFSQQLVEIDRYDIEDIVEEAEDVHMNELDIHDSADEFTVS